MARGKGKKSKYLFNFKKGFLVVAILGVVFILLLGGVGLKLISENQKISKAFLEVEELKKKGEREEAVKILKNLENNFLVRYFGFKRDEINKKIDEILSQREEKEIQEEKKEVPTTTTTPPQQNSEPFDCKDSLSCLIEMAKSCQWSKIESQISFLAKVYKISLIFEGEIEKGKEEKCKIKIKVKKVVSVKKKGIPDQDTLNWLKKNIEGKEILCLFKNEELVRWLKEIKNGVLPSFEGAQCKY